MGCSTLGFQRAKPVTREALRKETSIAPKGASLQNTHEPECALVYLPSGQFGSAPRTHRLDSDLALFGRQEI
jgi:hypothetical protein